MKLKSNSVSLMQNGACNIEITDEVRSSLLQVILFVYLFLFLLPSLCRLARAWHICTPNE